MLKIVKILVTNVDITIISCPEKFLKPKHYIDEPAQFEIWLNQNKKKLLNRSEP